MAAFRLVHREQDGLKRERVLRDKLHPFDIYNDTELLARYRYTRANLMIIIDSVTADILFNVARVGCLTPTIMVLVTLRVLAAGSFQLCVADMFGLSKATVCRTFHRVVRVLAGRLPQSARYVAMSSLL